MVFIGIALIIAAGLALAVNSGLVQMTGLTERQATQLVPLLIILVLVASSMFGRRENWRVLLSGAILWSGVLGIAIVAYAFRDELSVATERVVAVLQPSAPQSNPATGTVSIQRSYGGSFRVAALVNGTPVSMIFDTGATAVVLSHADAQKIGIDVDELIYTVPVETANGRGMAAATRLDRLAVGDIVRNDVRAFVAQDDALETSLLGMTFLETLTGYSVRRDALQLHD